MFRSRIYRRLFTPFVLILLVGLAGAWLAATQLFSETLEKRLRAQLADTVQMLSYGAFPYTPALLGRLSSLIHADIALLDTDGFISESTYAGKLQPLQLQFREILPGENNGRTFKEFELNGNHYLMTWSRIPNNRDPRFSFIVAFSNLSDIQQAGQRMAGWLGAGAFSGLLLLAWIGHLHSRSITLPIKELANMTREISAGNRHVRAKIHRRDEIGELAAALNSMALKLDDYEQELARQNRMAGLGMMTARIAHEIRNPLTAIKMQLELLRENAGPNNQALLDSLLDETRRLELIVLSTLQHKKIANPVFTSINLNDLIEEVLRLLRLQFEHQGLQLITSLSADISALKLDRDMIIQILLNLLLNAKDEMPEGGKIQISSGMDSVVNSIWFSVDDSGPGILEDNWKSLFSGSSSSKPDGFGFGLRLSQDLAELHGGHITIGRSPLGGARFTVTLPLQEKVT